MNRLKCEIVAFGQSLKYEVWSVKEITSNFKRILTITI